MAVSSGQRLGPYEILSAAGKGGMGEVYRARDTRLDRTVAIKILPDRLADRPDLRERFEREARAIASLNHPHICVLHDIGHQAGRQPGASRRGWPTAAAEWSSWQRATSNKRRGRGQRMGNSWRSINSIRPRSGISGCFGSASARRQPFLVTRFNEGAPHFSPDGRWLTYVSDESGGPEIYVQPYPGPGGKWQISTEGGTEPVWNPNGRELFYRNGTRMMAVDVTTQPTFSAGKPRMLFDRQYLSTPFPQTFPRYDASPDGQRFLMMKQAQQAPAEINVVQNWISELKSRARPGGN